MSKKNQGSSIDDFLKKEKNSRARGGLAEDEPLQADRILDPKRRYHALEFAAGGGLGGAAGGD